MTDRHEGLYGVDTSSTGQEFELYARAIGHLERANKVSEYTKTPELAQERDLARDAQRIGTRLVMAMPFREGQYERIFRREQEVTRLIKNEGNTRASIDRTDN